jgi:hypothetical protein
MLVEPVSTTATTVDRGKSFLFTWALISLILQKYGFKIECQVIKFLLSLLSPKVTYDSSLLGKLKVNYLSFTSPCLYSSSMNKVLPVLYGDGARPIMPSA